MHAPFQWSCLAALAATVVLLPTDASGRLQADDPAPIQRMVATERAFAAAAHEIGVRDSFLTFFADDAISIVRGTAGQPTSLVPAKAQLAARPLQALPLQADLLWEPFTGQVSGDGSMGWLTGGYAVLSSTSRDLLGQGAYFSVWKRQANGTWRVWKRNVTGRWRIVFETSHPGSGPARRDPA